MAATYRITPSPGGTWDAADAGTYVVSVAANEVFDSSGTAAPAQELVFFGVNPEADKSGPPAVELDATAVAAADAGKTTDTFFSDTAYATTPADANDMITVIGPNGFIETAESVSVDPAGNESPRTGMYRFAPPGGAWNSGYSGRTRLSSPGSYRTFA